MTGGTTKKVSSLNNQHSFWGTYCVGFVVHWILILRIS